MSLLPPKEDKAYGFFGYEGWVADSAIRSDNAPMLRECIDRGFVTPESKMLGPRNLRQWCEINAPKCFAMLEESFVAA